MDPFNIVKIIAAVITIIVAFTLGFRVLRLNPGETLNKWFALFFALSSLGFLLYTVYHLITPDSGIPKDLIIPFMIASHIFFNFAVVSLVMTVFILEKFKKVAMSPKYFGTMMALFIVMSFGYFIPIWTPYLNENDWNNDFVNTITPPPWFIFVNLLRIGLSIFVIYKYALMTRRIEENTKKKVKWFFIGIIFAVAMLLFNLIGGLIGITIISVLFEITALIALDIGIIAVFKAFLL
ncbi:MAG: hypothetical protein ACFE9C_06860 [Candidatus Hodarchaeota archaeon]